MTVAVFPGGELVLLRHAHPTDRQNTVLLGVVSGQTLQLSEKVERCDKLQPLPPVLPPGCRNHRRAHTAVRSRVSRRLQQTKLEDAQPALTHLLVSFVGALLKPAPELLRSVVEVATATDKNKSSLLYNLRSHGAAQSCWSRQHFQTLHPGR